MDKPIKNKASYPDAQWLSALRQIGTVAKEALYLVGYEYPGNLVDNPKQYPLVAIDRAGVDELFADTLGELLTNSRESIDITAEI